MPQPRMAVPFGCRHSSGKPRGRATTKHPTPDSSGAGSANELHDNEEELEVIDIDSVEECHRKCSPTQNSPIRIMTMPVPINWQWIPIEEINWED